MREIERAEMAHVVAFLEDVMTRALDELERQRFALHTLAFYLDHESSAVSVCADNAANSERAVARENEYNSRYFLDAVSEGDLAAAALWQANVGRNLSLGDFAAVNLARADLGDLPADAALCRGMVETIIKNHDCIRNLSADPVKAVVASSTLDDEVGLVWSLPGSSPRP